jgi:hypothetical protein
MHRNINEIVHSLSRLLYITAPVIVYVDVCYDKKPWVPKYTQDT